LSRHAAVRRQHPVGLSQQVLKVCVKLAIY
jgi:hypothetical protein